jgi:hypothetical protein
MFWQHFNRNGQDYWREVDYEYDVDGKPIIGTCVYTGRVTDVNPMHVE